MRATLLSVTVLLSSVSGMAAAQSSQQAARASGMPRTSEEALIANALSAAPASLAAHATVMGHDGRVLRQGTSDWVCMPDMPDVPNNAPMCLDASWRAFIDDLMHKRTPAVTKVGIGYMLQGDMPVSNTDPFATAATATNQWLDNSGPHVMVLVPDARLLESLSADPTSGGPYVMWKGTVYAHIMVPTRPPPK